jgi:7,8-dihydropterin-6-yl-methyl-4-(beta-D-ribofuranosyl)aminobenzene 5'-phosphate synthase
MIAPQIRGDFDEAVSGLCAVRARSPARGGFVKYLLAGHCTGIEATFRLRTIIGLTRKTAPVSSVGSSFTLGKGIDALDIGG